MALGRLGEGRKVPASHRVGVQPRGSTPTGLGSFGGERLNSPCATLTLKWPVLAKIWYLPWVVIREP